MKKTLVCIMVVAVAWSYTWAQQADNSASDNPELTGIKTKQEFIKEQFDKMLNQMRDRADKLEKAGQKDDAKAILQAVNHAQAAGIKGNMEQVIQDLLRNLTSDANGKVTDILDALQQMLNYLRDNTGIKATDIERAKQLSDMIGKMIPEQKELAKQSEVSRDADKIAKEMDSLNQRLKDVISEQKDLMNKTDAIKDGDPTIQKLADMRQKIADLLDKQNQLSKKLDETNEMDKLAIQGEQQKKLADQAQNVAKELDQASKDPAMSQAMQKAGADSKSMSDASQSTSKASQSMSQAGESLSKTDPESAGKKQDQAAYDLKKALEAMDNAMAKAGGNTPAGKLADQQKDLQKRTDQIDKDAQKLAEKTGAPAKGDNLSKASGEMGKAGDKLAGQKPQEAKKNQEEALRNLEDKKANKLAELNRRVKDKLAENTDKQSKKQGDLADRMQKMAEEMSKASDKNPEGMPGKQSMSKAGQSGKSAQGKLSKGQSGQANSDQQDASKEMEKAKQQLDEAIAKAEEEQQEKTMTKIAEILQDMLTRQQTFTTKTAEVAAKKGSDGKFQRPEEIELQNVSHDEGVLADDAKKVTKMLQDDKSTVVFPDMMKDVEADLRDIQNMLDAKQVDELVQAMQGNVERSLQELLDALKTEMSKRKAKKQGGQGQGQGQGGGKKDPLVPPTAELKALKQKEIGLNKLTEIANRQKESGKSLPTQVETQHKKLAQQQKDLESKVREFIKLLSSKKGPM